MGVDISHIIRHDFYEVENSKAAMSYAKDTILRLKKNLYISNDTEDFYLQDEGDDGGITFRLPIYDVDFFLHNGFWCIESYFHYCQIVMHSKDYFWLRRKIFDIARALGQEEAWYAEEYYTWNGGCCELPTDSFEEWYKRATLKYGDKIPEFNQESIIAQGDVHIPDYEPIYHDCFKECKELIVQLQNKIPEYELIGLQRTGYNLLRCKKDDELFLVNEETQEVVTTAPIEAMEHSLNGPEFIIYKNGLSAVFDGEGNQLTDFVKGAFHWRWDDKGFPARIIYNKDVGIEIKTYSMPV